MGLMENMGLVQKQREIKQIDVNLLVEHPDNFYDVARYIYYHDRDRVRGKKDRIDFLFEKIKKEAEPCRTIQEK